MAEREKIKVLLVISKFYPEYAGPGYRLHNTYKRLCEKFNNIEIEVLCNSTEYSTSEKYVHEGVNVTRISTSLSKYQSVNNKLLGTIIRILVAYIIACKTIYYLIIKNYNLIHTAGSSASIATSIIWSRLFLIPLLVELVTEGSGPRINLPGFRYIWQPKLSEKAVVIAISDALKRVCESENLIKNVWSRPNPVNENKYFVVNDSEKKEYRKKVKYEKEGILLLSIAKLMPQKNQLFLINVIKKLPQEYKLIIAGPTVESGPLYERDKQYLETLYRKIDDLSLNNRIDIVPSFVNSDVYIKASDVYLIPSIQEGLATPMLESLACGVPVVANKNISCFQQWVKNDTNGHLADLNEDDWVSAIISTIQIKKETLHKEAKKIINHASTSYIDKKYYEIFKLLHSNINTVDISNFNLYE